jgi:hypothetical protein
LLARGGLLYETCREKAVLLESAVAGVDIKFQKRKKKKTPPVY